MEQVFPAAGATFAPDRLHPPIGNFVQQDLAEARDQEYRRELAPQWGPLQSARPESVEAYRKHFEFESQTRAHFAQRRLERPPGLQFHGREQALQVPQFRIMANGAEAIPQFPASGVEPHEVPHLRPVVSQGDD
eukprot:11827650-Heterocapsa_arctica.AAC.1